ncbi:hypothetical protein QTP70_010132 [Hemibagrus guttatus]|uniref:Uncharacterized protein n=1 Tax=Hemibagrus guttatus TaxID=175788 RepID=A0AAE0PU79_9TELE|nr:hypothetical protein QTP70_010132 [Hemibagrus guttatus]
MNCKGSKSGTKSGTPTLCLLQSVWGSPLPVPTRLHTSAQSKVHEDMDNETAEENWDAEGCKTLPSPAVHTKCLCSKISTFAVLAHKAKEPDMGVSSLPSVPLMVGCGVSCMALLILLIIYAASWRYIRSERSIILLNFCLSILASNILILVGQSQTLSKTWKALTEKQLAQAVPDLTWL